MKIDSQRLAFLLKSSSLSSAEQRLVLARLPQYSESEIQQLYNRLEADHAAMREVLQSAHQQRAGIVADFEKALKNA